MTKAILIVLLVLGTFITLYRLSLSSRPPNLSNPSFVSAFVKLNQPQNPVDQIIKTLYPEPEASLLSGILIGSKAQMPKDFYSALQKTGTMHMIALSGQNISLVIALLAYLFAPLGKKLSSLATIFAIMGFILFVGPSASVIRAGLMGSLVMLSVIFGRQYLASLGLILSGLLMFIISPQVLFDIGYQLSFTATLGIVLLAGKVESKKSKKLLISLTSGLLFDLKTTLAAQLFTTPIVLFNFHNLSIVAPISNVLILWSIPFLMYGGFAVVLVDLFFFSLGAFFSLFTVFCYLLSDLLYPLLVWFVAVVNWTGSLSFASFTIPNFSLGMAYLYYGTLFLILSISSYCHSRSRIRHGTGSNRESI